MSISDAELREIYSSAPVIKDTFELISIKASWFSQDYHLQNMTTEDIEIELETGEFVIGQYTPMGIGLASSNADLTYERSIVVQSVNDIIAAEIANRDPESDDEPTVESRGYVMYRDGTISQLKTPVIATQVSKTTRNEKGTSMATSTKPANQYATGEVATPTRVPMLRAFV